MLHMFKRWFAGAPKAPTSALHRLATWADDRHFTSRVVRDEGGLVIDGRSGSAPWRLEWGPAQRAYVQGYELRLRAELGFGEDLQILVINRALQEAMERAVFEQYVQDVQTRIDDQTPPEMRWLVMFPKLSGAELGGLRDGFAAVANTKTWLMQWLDGALTSALAARRLPAEQPFVLMIGRGRLLLRTECNDTDDAIIEAWVRVFDTALREARRCHAQGSASTSPSTRPSLWSASSLPTEEQG